MGCCVAASFMQRRMPTTQHHGMQASCMITCAMQLAPQASWAAATSAGYRAFPAASTHMSVVTCAPGVFLVMLMLSALQPCEHTSEAEEPGPLGWRP